MANYKLTNFQETQNGKTYSYEGTTVKELAGVINNFFLSQGYKLEEGSLENAIYGIGNKVMRILFGAFVKRYTFHIVVKEADANTIVEFSKGMSGVSGGVIGVTKLNNEYKRLVEAMKNIS